MNVKIISKAVVLMLFVLVSCNVLQKTVSLFVVTGAADEVTISSATLNGTFVASNAMSATASVWFYIGTDSDNLERNGIRVEAGTVPSAGGNFSAVATGLEPNSIYYYVAYASMDGVQSKGSVSSFTTLSRPKEMIFTAEADNITETSAHLYGYVDLEQTGSSVEFGIILSRDENPTEGNGTVRKCYEVDRNNKYFAEFSGLDFATDYYYKAYVKVGTLLRVGEVKSFTTSGGETVVPGTYPEVVDLGLSVKWRAYNLGATCMEEYGDYVSWGETQPKDYYAWSTYKWCKENEKTLTKYCNNSDYGFNGFTDNKFDLDPDDDAATVTLGDKWRIPTKTEWEELHQNCTWKWARINGVYGRKVISNKTGYTDKWIFLPAAGYWSSSLSTNGPTGAYAIYSTRSKSGEGDNYRRCEERSVRPVYGDMPVTGVTLNKDNVLILVGETETLKVNVSPAHAANKTIVWVSSNESVATVNSDGVVSAIAAGTSVITVTTMDGGYVAECTVRVNNALTAMGKIYNAVDLGLSVKWASFNLGVTKPEEYGNYYAWGENASKSNYDWSTYKWCAGSEKTLTKYCYNSSYGYNGFTDNKKVLDQEDDVVAVLLGGYWRMPTKAEWEELKSNCRWTWTASNGVSGYRVTSMESGYTDKWIFLPAAGRRDGSRLYGAGSLGYYWSSSLDTDNPNVACYVYFVSGGVYWNYNYYGRYSGLSVRPVSE